MVRQVLCVAPRCWHNPVWAGGREEQLLYRFILVALTAPGRYATVKLKGLKQTFRLHAEARLKNNETIKERKTKWKKSGPSTALNVKWNKHKNMPVTSHINKNSQTLNNTPCWKDLISWRRNVGHTFRSQLCQRLQHLRFSAKAKLSRRLRVHPLEFSL